MENATLLRKEILFSHFDISIPGQRKPECIGGSGWDPAARGSRLVDGQSAFSTQLVVCRSSTQRVSTFGDSPRDVQTRRRDHWSTGHSDVRMEELHGFENVENLIQGQYFCMFSL